MRFNIHRINTDMKTRLNFLDFTIMGVIRRVFNLKE